MNDEEKKEELLGRTLAEVRQRRERRGRRRRLSGSGAALVAVAAAGGLAGLITGRGDDRGGVAHRPGIPLRVSDEWLSGTSMEDEVAVWSSPSALVLVVNADGMEMRALNESQVRALARKPGCRFALTPDNEMWVSEVGDDPQRFDLSPDF